LVVLAKILNEIRFNVSNCPKCAGLRSILYDFIYLKIRTLKVVLVLKKIFAILRIIDVSF